MIALIYPGGDYAEILRLYARYFHVQPINNKVFLPSHVGSGFFEFIELPMNIQAWLSDFIINDDLHLVRRKSEEEFINLRLDIIEGSQQTELLVNQKKAMGFSDKAYIFINSTRVGLAYKARKGAKAKSINLRLSKQTLKALLPQDSSFDLIECPGPGNDEELPVGQCFLPASVEMIGLLHQLFELDAAESQYKLKFFNRCLQLLELVVRQLKAGRQQVHAETRPISRPDYEAILQLEANITRDFTQELPPQDELAAKVYMSVSKLKYTFKSVFGTSIYTHYQKARMQKALELLQTGKALGEIADELGFKDPASLTRNFKKEFQLAPRQIRRISFSQRP